MFELESVVCMKIIYEFFNAKLIYFSLLVLAIFTLSACNFGTEDSDIMVTSVEVISADNATTITEEAGALQMTATVLPSNVSNTSVTWTVVNGTGIATISSTGLLTAQYNGTVTVTATSVLTPTVYGSKVITISNQPEANMDATLTNLNVGEHTVLGFHALVTNYTYVLSSGTTQTPVVTATKYVATSTVTIDNATDVTSTDIAARTTTITVTTTDDDEKIYTIVFESHTEAVDLGSAADYVILAESGVSTTSGSLITGDIGLSPAAATYYTGFSLTMHSSGEYSMSSQVVGKLYASDYTSPTPNLLTTAIEDMMTAYSDAAGRPANYTELYSGNLSGKTLSPGVFKFGTSVLINTDLTLNGSEDDVWIFQIAGNLTMASDINIILEGGAQASNIFWQVSDTVVIGSGSHFEGIILALTNISMETNSSMNGQLYAQTAVTLDAVIVTKSTD